MHRVIFKSIKIFWWSSSAKFSTNTLRIRNFQGESFWTINSLFQMAYPHQIQKNRGTYPLPPSLRVWESHWLVWISSGLHSNLCTILMLMFVCKKWKGILKRNHWKVVQHWKSVFLWSSLYIFYSGERFGSSILFRHNVILSILWILFQLTKNLIGYLLLPTRMSPIAQFLLFARTTTCLYY